MSGTSLHSISCRNCREKKIRCNKVIPRCNKCAASGTECIYLTRRPRARKPRPVAITEETLNSILDRLDRLERHQNISRSPTRALSPGSTSESEQTTIDELEKTASGNEENEFSQSATSLSYLVKEATNVAREILHHPSHMDSARDMENRNVLDTLETVAADLNHFKMKENDVEADTSEGKPSKEDAKKWLTQFFDSHFPFYALPALMDHEFLLMIPDLLDKTPHVQISPATLISYYGVVFQGMILDEDPMSGAERQKHFKWMYRTTLGLVEKWQREIKTTMMDFCAAYWACWMAKELLDMQLSWQFFCRACRIAREMGFFTVDDGNTMSGDDELTRDLKRQVFWNLLQTDVSFRLHYGKPAVIRSGTWNVNFPQALMETAGNASLRADQITFIVSVRLALIVIKSFEVPENMPDRDTIIDSLSDEIKVILRDWRIEERFHRSSTGLDRWLYADCLFNCNTTTTLLYRSSGGTPNQNAVAAARASVTLMKVMSTSYPYHSHWSIEFVSYYPFVSFFTLFYNILAPNTSYETASADLDLMLWMGNALSEWRRDREELGPLEAVAKALNKVGRYVLSVKEPSQQPPSVGRLDLEGDMNVIDFESFLAAPVEYARGLETGIWRTDSHADWWDAV